MGGSTDNEDERTPIGPLEVIEQAAGLALAMAIWDLSLGCRVEPDLFSMRPGERPKVASFRAEDYSDAVQQSLDLISRRFEEGYSLCALAYQGFEETEDGGRGQVIVVRVAWNSDDEAIITVPWIDDDGTVAWLGPLAICEVKGTPDLSAMKGPFWQAFHYFPMGTASGVN
jgi:hypothetical protein